MEVAYTIGGGGLHMKNYRMEATAIASGVPVRSNAITGNTSGVLPVSTTSAIACMGLAVDTRTASTLAQVAAGAGDLSDGNNASFTKVVINADACYRAKLNNGATEDTALAIITQNTASADGLAPGATVTDEATVWGYSGANVGHARIATDTDAVLLAFPNAIAANDEFLQVLLIEASSDQFPTLTAAFTQIDATAAVAATLDNFTVVEFELHDASNDGQNNSFAIIMSANHAFGSPGVVA